MNLKIEKNSIPGGKRVNQTGWKAVKYSDTREAIHMLRFLLSLKGRHLLRVMSDEFQTVSEIRNLTRLEQSEVSVALQQMRRFDLVLVERVGKYHYYKLDYYRLSHIFEITGKLAAFYDPDDSGKPDIEGENPGNTVEEIGILQVKGG